MTDNNMEVISHLNISVGLFPFSKILNVSISHHPNSFGRCEIVGRNGSCSSGRSLKPD